MNFETAFTLEHVSDERTFLKVKFDMERQRLSASLSIITFDINDFTDFRLIGFPIPSIGKLQVRSTF